MRDTSDMMEDTFSEETMMDCGGDGGGLDDLVDLTTDVTDSSSTIRDAAERLLTLLGVDDENEDLISSSEDEGVELDVDELEDDEEEQENDRLLHHLAASLAQELKQSYRQKQCSSKLLVKNNLDRDQTEHMDTSYLEHSCLQEQDIVKGPGCYRENSPDKRQKQDSASSWAEDSLLTGSDECLEDRLRMDEDTEQARTYRQQVPASWSAGWDACAAEALRYLVEDEGLPPHHPTVLAMKDHLELQRERAFAQYAA